VMAHVLSHHGPIGYCNGRVTIPVCPMEGPFIKRATANSLGNVNVVSGIIATYTRIADHDPLSGDSAAVGLAIGGIACGLPIGEMLGLIPKARLDADAIAKAVVSAVDAYKETGLVIPPTLETGAPKGRRMGDAPSEGRADDGMDHDAVGMKSKDGKKHRKADDESSSSSESSESEAEDGMEVPSLEAAHRKK
jgi:hypothetical protein